MSEDIFAVLRSAASPDQAATMAHYMKDHFPFLGLPTPVRKKLSRDFLKSLDKSTIDWAFIDRCWQQAEREFQYLAIDALIKSQEALTPADLPRLQTLLTTKSWWDTIDALDVVVGGLALRYPEVSQSLLDWSRGQGSDGDNRWLRRTAIDHQLLRKERTDTDLLEQILVNNLGQGDFFITKAIGWALRDYSKTNPAWVRAFLDRYRAQLAPLSVKEASKYL